MKKLLIRTGVVWFLIAIPLLSGCASVNSVRAAPEFKGEERLFDVSYEHMVGTVETMLPLLGLENVDKQSNDPRITVFVGTHGVTAASWGEVVRVIVTEVDVAKTSVRVYWRSKFRDGLITSAPDWNEEVFAGIEERVF